MTTLTMVLWHAADLVVTQGGADKAPSDGGLGGGLMGMAPLLLMFGVIYLLLIRPAGKQRKQHQQLLNELKKNDEVVTSGGIYGRIIGLDERVVTLEIASSVKIKILRDRIAGRWAPAPASDKK